MIAMDTAMTGTSLLIYGIVLGISIAAPVGPIGVLCIRRTLAAGLLPGLATGLGAAVADGLYGAIAAFGIASVANLLMAVNLWLRLAGGAFLIWLGWRTISRKTEDTLQENHRDIGELSLATDFASTFLLTLANPMTIISFSAIFMGLGKDIATAGATGPLLLVMGVFSGSALWWLGLSSFFSLFRKKMTPTAMKWVNRVSGSVIVLFGAIVLLDAII
jgi:threonine/homoserine/homoserine lactone efflux protein